MAKFKELPDIEYLNSIFTLDVESGVLYWKVSLSPVIKVGAKAGAIRIFRNVRIKIDIYIFAADNFSFI